MTHAPLAAAIDAVPPGAWVVGVSGGADSMALLSLLRQRRDLHLTIAHLDHGMRSGASAADAQFVRHLAQQWNIPVVLAQRHEIESSAAGLPSNLSARLRMLRLQFFRDTVLSHHAHGVITAHHADDQAETIFLRLLRSAGPTGLAGMASRTTIGGLTLLRPLLDIRSTVLRSYLEAGGIAWREDQSNVSPRYRRNRVRRMLARYPQLHQPLLAVAEAARRYRAWLQETAPMLRESFELIDVRGLPEPLRREALRKWLLARGAAPQGLTPAVLERLTSMVNDAASPARQHFPGKLLVRRRTGRILIDR
jgi:tRNA(Ile)-lysidine synthase